MATRSKETLVATIKLEIQEAFKSAEFQKIIQSAIEEALNVAISKVIEPLTKTIVDLQEIVSSLESQLSSVSNMANDNEQYSRRHNARISGFDEEQGEICGEKIATFCKEKLKVDISDKNIDRAPRVGKPREDRPRAIIVRFNSHKDKIAVMRQRRELYSSHYYINEDLTSRNQHLLYEAKKKCRNVGSAWSKDGKIFAKRASDSKIFRLISVDDLSTYGLVDFAY